MANEQDKTVVEAGDNPVTPGSAPAKGKSKLIVFGGIGLGAIIIGVVVALFVLKPMLASSDDPTEPATHAAATAKTESDSHGKSEASGKKEGESSATMYEIDDIVINPAGTGGSRFLSVSFGFELQSASDAETFRTREPIIRDALITILSSKTVAQLTDARQKEIIRYQIKKRVSELMKTSELAGVYYTDFVLQ